MSLGDRLEELGKVLGEREAAHGDALRAAWTRAQELNQVVEKALERFHAAVDAAGAGHLRIALGAPRVDDKHVHAVEFDVSRGRHRAIVTVKSRGDVTLVGPFRQGKAEGPCKSFPFEADAEIERALGDFLLRFIEEAATP